MPQPSPWRCFSGKLYCGPPCMRHGQTPKEFEGSSTLLVLLGLLDQNFGGEGASHILAPNKASQEAPYWFLQKGVPTVSMYTRITCERHCVQTRSPGPHLWLSTCRALPLSLHCPMNQDLGFLVWGFRMCPMGYPFTTPSH